MRRPDLSELEPELAISPALSTCLDRLILSLKLIKKICESVWFKVDTPVLSFTSANNE
jgi:hypothetical protein